MIDLDQARAEVLAAARRHGEQVVRRQEGRGDSSSFYETNRTRLDLDAACAAYARALGGP